MTNYGVVKSLARPQDIEITDEMVFIASNVEACELDGAEGPIQGYQYNYVGYTKNEYLLRQNEQLTALAQ
jgi:hypothetical protein